MKKSCNVIEVVIFAEIHFYGFKIFLHLLLFFFVFGLYNCPKTAKLKLSFVPSGTMLMARIKPNCFAERAGIIDKQNKVDLNKT